MRLGLVAVVLLVAAGGPAAAALLAWPQVRVVPDGDALARVALPSIAGRVTAIAVRSASGAEVPVRLRDGRLWPERQVAAGEELSVELTVRRPRWAGWLVGRSERRAFTVETPTAHLLGRWLQTKAGSPVTVAFDRPVGRVSLGGAHARDLAAPRSSIEIGGAHATGSIEVAAAARAWELLPAPVRVTWFPARPDPQLLARPAPGRLAPDGELALTFSAPVRDVLGARRLRLSPATPGRWRRLDAHTLAFDPSGLGFGLGARVSVRLPRAVHLTRSAGATLTRTLRWQVPDGSTLRLQQLLAEFGYLPLDWQPATLIRPSTRSELAAAITPPPGHFTWRYPHTPPELKALWRQGSANQITRGAVMSFEHDHRLAVDAIAGPHVWRQLIADALANRLKRGGYSYVYVHRDQPQSLNLWHNGRVVLTSPGNTGVPAAPPSSAPSRSSSTFPSAR